MEMSDLPLVSIGMPVWNGEAFLTEAIDSLLKQDYANIELLILDNMSTDNTGRICESFAAKDKRVRYIPDTRLRTVIEAFNEIARLVKGEYFMVGCDDDVYDSRYISTLMNILLKDASLGLAYSGCNSIYPDESVRPSIWKWRLTKNGSRFLNFIKYFFKRNPIPICFGVMKTTIHRDGLKYFFRPDSRGWNHDNLYMLRILSMAKVHGTGERLFNYRERDRAKLYSKRGQWYQQLGTFAQIKSTALHQLSVSQVALKIATVAPFNIFQKMMAWVYIPVCTIYFAFADRIIVPVVRGVKKLFLQQPRPHIEN